MVVLNELLARRNAVAVTLLLPVRSTSHIAVLGKGPMSPVRDSPLLVHTSYVEMKGATVPEAPLLDHGSGVDFEAHSVRTKHATGNAAQGAVRAVLCLEMSKEVMHRVEDGLD